MDINKNSYEGEGKLALGTAQFGLDYGISNERGKIPKEEVFEILEIALDNGIDTLDTASAYGDSEEVIGEFIERRGSDFKIITKINGLKEFGESLRRLNVEQVYGCLIHSFEEFQKRPGIWEELKKLREDGKVGKIGFSLYHPSEVRELFEKNIVPDIVQIPFNIFDQRFKEVFSLLKGKNVEIHARSLFLQGLFFKDPNNLEGKFCKIRDKLLKINSISKSKEIPVSALCLGFGELDENIKKIVVGVDSVENLKENLNYLEYEGGIKEVYGELEKLQEDDEEIILPTTW